MSGIATRTGRPWPYYVPRTLHARGGSCVHSPSHSAVIAVILGVQVGHLVDERVVQPGHVDSSWNESPEAPKPRHFMYAIYAAPLTPLAPPQLIGIHGSPMECLGNWNKKRTNLSSISAPLVIRSLVAKAKPPHLSATAPGLPEPFGPP